MDQLLMWALVSLKDISSAAVTLTGFARASIRGDDANNQFSLLGEGP